MQFLRTLFWVVVAVGLVLFASANWRAVTITLWGGLEADIKLPILVLGAFLLGFLPMLLIHRARLWTLRRRLDAHERQAAAMAAMPPPAPAPAEEAQPTAAAPPAHSPQDRIATDSKVWPAA